MIRNESDKSISKIFIEEVKETILFILTCILPDYVGHESLKEFWKNSSFENMRADFLRMCQNSLGQTIPERMHFQA